MRDKPDFTVDQITLVIDSLGGYSHNLRENIGKMFEDDRTVEYIIRKMQKSVLNNSYSLSYFTNFWLWSLLYIFFVICEHSENTLRPTD